MTGAVFFGMLFTVGTSYILFVNDANSQYHRQLLQRIGTTHQGLQENLILTPGLSSSNSHITFYVNNTGGVNANVTAFFVLDLGGTVLKCGGRGLPSGTCSSWNPISVNIGKGSVTIDTGYAYNALVSPDTIRIITETGGAFTQTYPLTPYPAANVAVTTVGAGFAELNFATFRAYNSTGPSRGCQPWATGCQLDTWPAGKNAYTMDSLATGGKWFMFAVDITNVDPARKTLVLDSNSELTDYFPPTAGGGTASSFFWGIGSVSSSGVTQAFSSVTIGAGQTVTLYFLNPSQTNAPQWPGAGFAAIFIFLHGTRGGAPYGQNIPFVTTLYK